MTVLPSLWCMAWLRRQQPSLASQSASSLDSNPHLFPQPDRLQRHEPASGFTAKGATCFRPGRSQSGPCLQLRTFGQIGCRILQRPVLLIGKSIRGVAALRAAQLLDDQGKGVVLIDCAQTAHRQQATGEPTGLDAWITPLLMRLVRQRWLSTACFATRHARHSSVACLNRLIRVVRMWMMTWCLSYWSPANARELQKHFAASSIFEQSPSSWFTRQFSAACALVWGVSNF